MTGTRITRVSAVNSVRRRGRPLGRTALAIRDAVIGLTDRFDRMTVRQIFYQLEVAEIVEKSETGYRQVQAQVLRMRREHLLAWDFITDGTRWQRKDDSYEDAGDAVVALARSYRRDLWQSQNVRIEIWLEKDGLADVLWTVTANWDVSLMVSRGQSSATFLYSAAKAAEAAWEKDAIETFIFALFDYDAGGMRAARTVEIELPSYAPDVPIHFERLAVNEQQVIDWQLPTRPPKKKDPDAAKFLEEYGAVAVELDAIDPVQLQTLVADAIVGLIDPHAWKLEQAIEEEERKGLLALSGWEPPQ